MTRRTLLLSLPIMATASRLLAQAGVPALTVRALSHMTLTVSDRKRSLAFYQGLFGWPVQHNQGTSTGIRIGAGPQYVSLSQGGPNAKPGINHFCVTVEGFSVAHVTDVLGRHGVVKGDNAAATAMQAWVRMRGEDAGGAPEGTPEFYVNDPDGIRFQVQDPRYCGGRGVLGEICPNPPATKGLLVVRDYQNFTLSASNPQRTLDFYQRLFGMKPRGQQGSVSSLAFGAGPQGLIIEGTGAGVPPRNSHASLVMDAFEVPGVQKALSEFGVRPGPVPTGEPGPLVSFVRTRGGATELFFTDPDGILIRLQGAS